MATKQILNSSESVEWYTPAPYVEAAREVLGGIELDPASCAEAQETIKAEHYYTQEEVSTASDGDRVAFQADGLARPWVARSVFLNSPYGIREGKSNQALWSQKLTRVCRNQSAAERGALDLDPGAGLVQSAILLVNACTSEKWFQPLWQYPICFPDHRIKFDHPKIRRYPALGVDGSPELRKLLSGKPLRIWSEMHRGWWACEQNEWVGSTEHVAASAVKPFDGDDKAAAKALLRRGAWAGIAARFGSVREISFDRADVPTQPTKGQAFVYFGSDPLVFAHKFQQFGPVVQAMKIHAGPRRHAFRLSDAEYAEARAIA